MFELERGFEQRIVLQIDLPDRKVIRRAPISVHFFQQIGRQRGTHRRLLTGSFTRHGHLGGRSVRSGFKPLKARSAMAIGPDLFTQPFLAATFCPKMLYRDLPTSCVASLSTRITSSREIIPTN